MANPKKQNGKKKQKRKEPAAEPVPGGRLFSLDGTQGPALTSEAARLAGMCCHGEPAWSVWDASNTFHDLGMLKTRNLTPTPRSLVLLYASDLLFRLRWEIEPTLKEGRDVVAGPYVETAVAWGVAAGLPKDWMEQLFSFAPKPVAAFRLKEKKNLNGKKDKEKEKKKNGAKPGFVEFCSAALSRTSPDWDPAAVRAEMIRYFKELEKQKAIRKFGKKAPKLA